MSGLATFTIHNGDALAVLKTLPSESVHCAVTSPPYFNLRDYNCSGQIGREASREDHIDKLVSVFDEVRRVLRSDGSLWLNYGDCYINKQLQGMPWRVALALQEAGWILRSDCIWNKLNALPESVKDRPSRSHEYMFLLAKSEKYYYDAEAVKEQVAASTGPRLLRAVGSSHKNIAGAPGQTPHTLSRPRANTRKWESETSDIQGHGVPRGHSGIYRADGTITAGGDKRNKRTIWPVATEPQPEKHFATFPTKLITPCILASTSEYGCCSICGSPWRRQLEASADYARHLGRGHHDHSQDAERGMMQSKVKDFHAVNAEYVTTGWRSICECKGAEIEACTVLDPFAGAGTTLLVANRLGRHGVGIELNPEYVSIAQRRLIADAPLLVKGIIA